MAHIYYVMGVSSSGKSTIGRLLANHLGIPFFDGDDFHPIENINKMKSGQPLNDDDRRPWLLSLQALAEENSAKAGAVIATSALKQSYRDLLERDIPNKDIDWVFLHGTFDTINQRMQERSEHFMPMDLLRSQFDTLEIPENAIKVSILNSPEQIIKDIINQSKMSKSEFGLIGLGVMGKSLSLNLAENNFKLSLYNRHQDGIEENIARDFIDSHELLQKAKGFDDLEAFIASLEVPRKIFMMIKAGPALDKVIGIIKPHLDEGDILIDGGNSHYKDTSRRMQALKEDGIHFIGSGVSGGEEGARKGPSIMPGGPKAAYEKISPYLEAIAAKDNSGGSCCAYIGKEGAGHFVKMVHNGIEYAEMQLLAEVYTLLRFGLDKSPDLIADILQTWRADGLDSYLLEITVDILRTKEGEDFLIDKILDKAGNKGTGSWTTIAAADLGIPSTMITAALFARYTSAFKAIRVAQSKIFNNIPEQITFDSNVLRDAYRLARLLNHQQGFWLISAAGTAYDWSLNLPEIARIWTNGCIIRSELMESLVDVLKHNGDILEDTSLQSAVSQNRNALQKIIKVGLDAQLPLPCFSAASTYLLTFAQARSSANIIQAQRDYFGAHTYQRVDDPSGKAHHTQWKKQ
jgi:6-phosphogluconate dehydrogenase